MIPLAVDKRAMYLRFYTKFFFVIYARLLVILLFSQEIVLRNESTSTNLHEVRRLIYRQYTKYL